MKISEFNHFVAVIFLFVAFMHALRLTLGITVVVTLSSTVVWVVPMWVSAVAGVVAFWLSICSFIFAIRAIREGK